MADLSQRIRAGVDLQQAEPAYALFLTRLFDDRLTEIRHDRWATSVRTLEGLGDIVLRSAGSQQDSAVVETSEALGYVTLGSGYVYVQTAAADGETASRALASLRELLPAPEPVARHDVPVTFWTYTPNGPMPSVRPIAVPGWEEIRDNYSAQTRAELESLMHDFRPAHGGQLVLWHGDAGTGKTFALRALAWEWREWCQIHYIVDPDTFFGDRADYLMAVLMQPDEMMAGLQMMRAFHGFGPAIFHHHVAMDDEDDDGDGPDAGKHWRLLVLEDTGELLTPDAKSIIGQGLSRFLNVVDGLIGQGLRVLVLVTTNEELRRLHPAVARPGRCAANVGFGPLTADEASGWLRAHGREPERNERKILASLFAELDGADPGSTRSVGFAER